MSGDPAKGISGVAKYNAKSMTGATDATIEFVKSLGVASASEMSFSQLVELGNMNIKENTKMILANAAAWAKSPLGMATIAAVGIFAIIKLVDLFTVSLEESREKLAQLKEEYSNNENELKAMNDELKTTSDRIDELEEKDSLTFTEAEELENLKEQNAELAQTIALLEKEQQLKQKELRKTFIETMEKDVDKAGEYVQSSPYTSSMYTPQYEVTASNVNSYITERDYINSMLKRREEIIEALSGELSTKEREQLEEYLSFIDKFLIDKGQEYANAADGIEYISSPKTEDEKATNEWLNFIKDFNDKISIAMNADEAKETALGRLVYGEFSEATSSLKALGAQGLVTAEHLSSPAYDSFIAKCIDLGIITDDSRESLAFLALYFNSLGEAAASANNQTGAAEETLEQTINTINDGIDGVQSKISTLSDALTKLQDGTLGVNDVIDLLQQFPELAEYVDLTADGFGDLEQGLKELSRSAPDDLIESLQEFKETKELTADQASQIDNLCSALRNLPTDAVKNATDEFGVLAESIRAATQAQNDLEKALAEDDWDAGYDGRVEAFTGFNEVLNAGEYGSKAYAAYKEYFGLIEKTPEQISAWMESNKKYFTEGTDGVIAFLKTVESLSGDGGALDGIASFDSVSGEFWYDINALGSFAEALGWTEEMLQDFINKYRMYVEEWTSRSAQDNLTEFTNAGIILDIDDGSFASLEKLIEYTGSSKEEVLDLVSAINDLRTQQGLEPIQLVGVDQIHITQSMIDNLLVMYGDANLVKEKLLELTQGDYTIDAGVKLEGQTIDEIIAEATGSGAESVTVGITMNVNDEEVLATVTTTAAQIKGILGENWEAKITGDTLDAEEHIQTVDDLLAGLPEDTLVTISDSTGYVRSSLSIVTDYLDIIERNKNQTITIKYRTVGSPPTIANNATGTQNATKGLSLLGDEYSPDGAPKPELVVTDNGAYIAGQNGPEIGYLNEGDVVYTADETKRILNNKSSGETIQAHAGGTANGLLNRVSTGGYQSGNYSSGSTPKPSSSSKDSSSKSNDKDESEFERLYKYHQHLLAMDKESVEEYLKWLNEAYKAAYKAGEIELDDFYKYEEEVHDKLQDLFKDYLSDIEHEISMRENYEGETKTILNLYQNMLDAIVKEIAAARAAGLDDTDDYIQELQKQWQDYSESVKEIQEDITNEAKDAVDELIDFRIDMIKKDLENEKDAIGEKLEYLRDFYQKQKDLLQESYDEEKYLEEQTEKRKSVSALEEELARLDYDNSAWAQKRKLELQEELADARKELNDFEKDHALQIAQEELDAQLALQEKEIEAEQALIDDKLNNAKALYEQALDDIRNGSVALYEEMIEYNALMGTGVDEDVTQMWKAAYTALQDYYDLYKEHYKDIRLANATGEVATDKGWDDAVISGSKPITQTTVSSSSGSSSSNSSTSPSLSKGASVTIKSSATHFGSKSGGVRMAAFVPGGTYTVYQTSGNEVLIGRNGAYTGWVKKTDIVGYASGTKHATVGIHEVDERGVEYIFESPSDGSRYRMFTGGEKVLNAKATDFLYNFATTGGGVLSNMFANAFKAVGLTGLTGRAQTVNLTTGNVIVQGNAGAQTVSEIRRAQRDSISYMLKEFNKLNK